MVNSAFASKATNWNAVDEWPEIGVPSEIKRCAAQMPEAEQMQFATAGPGTIRRPIDTAVEGDDGASDELGEEIDPATEASSKGAAGSNDENYEEETVVGIDQAGNPSVVEHFAAFKLQLDLLQKHVQSSAAQPEASSDMTAMTARTARQAESARIVLDLQAAGGSF